MKIPLLNRVLTLEKKEKREYTLDDDRLWHRLYGKRASKSGADVNDFTAMQNTAVWACIRVLSWTLASLPLVTYRRLDPRGKERATDNLIYKLLHDQPNPVQTSFTFRSTAMSHLCLRGNAYAEIEFNGRGEPVALWQIPPWRARPKVVNKKTIVYEISLDNEPLHYAPDYAMLHIRGLSTDGLMGLGVIQHAREAIGLSMAAEEFGARYFGEGTNLGGVLQHPAELGDKAYKRLQDSMKEQYQGLGHSHRLMLLEEGMKFEKLGIPPDQSQFLETRHFQVAEIARMFGVPLHKIGELQYATFSNIEHQGIEFVVDTMRPWLVNWEQEIKRKLFSDSDEFAEFLVDGLLRGDTQTRFAAYAQARNWGWMSANDVRELENLNPLPDEQGDLYLVPMNMQPAEWLTGASEPPPVLPEASGGRSIEVRGITKTRFKVAQSYRRIFEDAGQRIVEREVQNIRRYVKKHLAERSVENDENLRWAKPDDDSAHLDEKLDVRRKAIKSSKKGIAIELYAGEGHITKLYKADFKTVICVEKDSSKIKHLKELVGADNVFESDNKKWIADELENYQDFDLVDFDHYGSPCPLIQVFMKKLKELGKDGSFVLTLTDGGVHGLSRGGSVNPHEYWMTGKDEVIQPLNDNPDLIEKFDNVVDEFIGKAAKIIGKKSTKIDSLFKPHRIYYACYKIS